MADRDFTEQDLVQLARRGVKIDEARRQLELLRHPPPFIRLDRPCTAGDGIHVLSAADEQAAVRQYADACGSGRVLKFVPASGAASRMFRTLLSARDRGGEVRRAETAARAATGDAAAQEMLAFMDGLTRFAFCEDLRRAMTRDGLDLDALDRAGWFDGILEYLLTPKGLDYAARPKGLLQFHRYGSDSRTPFEEHLVEAAAYARDRDGRCRLHFTVSPQHRSGFVQLLERIAPVYERVHNAHFEVDFSAQKDSTDTIAAEIDGRPFRTIDGQLLFRPGGHGALIQNLNDLHGDVIFIKNIDNVVPDHLKADTIHWKQVLGGYLVMMQQRIFAQRAALAADARKPDAFDAAMRLLKELHVSVPPTLAASGGAALRAFLIEQLDRPLRVCGMVRNTGEPGGGPFWVRDRRGQVSVQIVESAQVDPDSLEQQAIFSESTYFNPVDLVCGVRDWQGRPFDLTRCVDADAVFIARKSQDGRELKALELPGLWNGAMAQWTAIFVEVPITTFNPVKTVNDLLRSEHQPV
ncbi:MAG: DUF4301 family protein [Deltaproteobacteria bacterium]|nr:DUF4301 family protein [Deltaproteobacteria bacterium]MBI3389885.1 DUF4301 family protein [Deltaproteobacteria bacterium]